MIRVGEENDYAAEVPFNLPLEADPLTGLTGYTFTTGEVRVNTPDAPGLVNADTARIREVGYGRFAYRTTSAQRSLAGTIFLSAVVSGCQPFRGSETVGYQGGDIAIGGTGWLVFYLAQIVDPVFGDPLSGEFVSLPGAIARVCWPDDTYVDVDLSTVEEFGDGQYGIPVSSVNTGKAGKVYYYATATGAQPYESYSTILPGVVAPSTPVVLPDPVESPYTPDALAYTDFVQAAIDRLPEQFKAKAF